MKEYKKEFIRFLVECDALKFGEFKLKSGRITQYFINTGMFDSGKKIKKLGEYYASAIIEHFGEKFDAVYGPAYKGIPLCVATSIGLEKNGVDKGYVFNRKLVKEYGMKDSLIGMKVNENSTLVLVDDVITSGKAIRESLDILKKNGNPNVMGIIISVDRQEKGTTDKNALKEVAEDLGIPIFSIVKLNDIIEVLHNKKIDGKIYIDDKTLDKMNKYRQVYGAE